MGEMQRSAQIDHFLKQAGLSHAQKLPLAGDASFRRYIRLKTPEKTYMLMDAPPQKESVGRFLCVARFLHRQGYSAPQVLAADETSGLVLLEDFGDDSFTRLLSQGRGSEHDYYAAAVDVLADWHAKSAGFASPELALAPYDEALLMQEVSLFSQWFLPQCTPDHALLAEEYLALWRAILAQTPLEARHFVHRDYHADNLLWLAGRDGLKRVGLLDFQDAVQGDAAYDLVSLLEDARRDVPTAVVEAMLARYLERAGPPREAFLQRYAVLGAQRNSKIIGIFVRLLARDGKPHYLRFLPRVWAHLEHDLRHPALEPLRHWLARHVPQEWRNDLPSLHAQKAQA